MRASVPLAGDGEEHRRQDYEQCPLHCSALLMAKYAVQKGRRGRCALPYPNTAIRLSSFGDYQIGRKLLCGSSGVNGS
jgi:hypothetical protein